MSIYKISSTDDHGIETKMEFESNFDYEEDYMDFVKMMFRFLIKNGVDVPEEVLELMDNH